VVSVDELHACGLDHRAITLRVARGRLHRVHRGVYAVGHAAITLEGRFLAAVKASGRGATLSHWSAAALWKIVESDERHPEVTVVGATARRHPGIRIHRTTQLERVDVRSTSGIPITAPARTLVDLATQINYRGLRRAMREAFALKLVNARQLHEAMRRAGPRRGVRNLRRILADGPTPTRTVLEDVVLDLILDAGLVRPDVNRPLRLDGRRVVPDFRWPKQQLVIEADGAAWHDHRLAREDDAERQALLEAHGERVLRVTWAQAIGQPSRTAARIRAAGAPNSSSGT
jgi:very-short-patch-repair endonuclease